MIPGFSGLFSYIAPFGLRGSTISANSNISLLGEGLMTVVARIPFVSTFLLATLLEALKQVPVLVLRFSA